MRLLTVFLLTLTTKTLMAQNAWEGVTIRYGVITPSLDLRATSPDTSARDLEYRPSTQGKSFVGVDYKNYGASLSASNPRDSEFRTKYGNGRSVDFQFRYTLNEYYIESYYQQYKGYYLSNAGRVMTNPFGPNNEYPQNSGLKTEHYGAVVFKFLSPEKFHPRRAFEMIEKPNGSGGSWYYSAGLNAHKLRTTESLVPATAVHNYAQLADLRSAQAYTLSIGGGGGYSWVFREAWILSGLFGLSLGNQWIKAKYEDDKDEQNLLGVKSHVKIATGYSGEQFFAAISIQGDNTPLISQNSELEFSTLETGIVFGWRF